MNFLSVLAKKSENKGITVEMCSNDSDTTIFKATLQIKDASALVFTDDTDNSCLLIHHVDTSQELKWNLCKGHDKKERS